MAKNRKQGWLGISRLDESTNLHTCQTFSCQTTNQTKSANPTDLSTSFGRPFPSRGTKTLAITQNPLMTHASSHQHQHPIWQITWNLVEHAKKDWHPRRDSLELEPVEMRTSLFITVTVEYAVKFCLELRSPHYFPPMGSESSSPLKF